MAVCMLRIFTGASLRLILVGCYALIFFLAAFCARNFLGVAFDFGGVATDPMTLPFILTLGSVYPTYEVIAEQRQTVSDLLRYVL